MAEHTLSYKEISKFSGKTDERDTDRITVSRMQALLFKKHLRAMFGQRPKGLLSSARDTISFWVTHLQILLLAPRLIELDGFYDIRNPDTQIEFHEDANGFAVIEVLPHLRDV